MSETYIKDLCLHRPGDFVGFFGHRKRDPAHDDEGPRGLTIHVRRNEVEVPWDQLPSPDQVKILNSIVRSSVQLEAKGGVSYLDDLVPLVAAIPEGERKELDQAVAAAQEAAARSPPAKPAARTGSIQQFQFTTVEMPFIKFDRPPKGEAAPASQRLEAVLDALPPEARARLEKLIGVKKTQVVVRKYDTSNLQALTTRRALESKLPDPWKDHPGIGALPPATREQAVDQVGGALRALPDKERAWIFTELGDVTKEVQGDAGEVLRAVARAAGVQLPAPNLEVAREVDGGGTGGPPAGGA